MDITYLGHSSFKIKTKKASLVTDPFDPAKVGLKYPPVEADVVTISHDHDDHNRSDLVKNARKVITRPGEYEIGEISIIGIASYHDSAEGEERGLNTIYLIEADDIRIAHLGDLGHELSDKDLAQMGEVDILIIPVGGVYTLNASSAATVARVIEPKIIIPMHYQIAGLKADTFAQLTGVEEFETQMGLPVERMDKLIIKSELDMENRKVVVLEKK